MPSHMLWSHQSGITIIHFKKNNTNWQNQMQKIGPLIIDLLFNKNLIGDKKWNINNPIKIAEH